MRMDALDHFELTTDSLAVRDARRRVRAFDDLPPTTIADAELVVSELVANSLLHSGLGPSGLIDVTLRRDSDRLVIVVDDHGSLSRRPRGSRGLGFRILDSLCERWEIEPGRVSATIQVAGAGAAESPARQGPPVAGAGPSERPYEPFAPTAARA
jgi:anti-sigma regulatory factor (Ser/Thr protein kinase)